MHMMSFHLEFMIIVEEGQKFCFKANTQILC